MTSDRNRRQRVAVRGTLLVIAAAALAAVCYLIAVTPPTPDSYYPKCVLYQTTGLHCPGCGGGRAAHALLNGRVLSAIHFNALSVLILPVIAFVLIRTAIGRAFAIPVRLRKPLPAWCIWMLFVVIVTFGVLRNIPVYPLTLLAPAELRPDSPANGSVNVP